MIRQRNSNREDNPPPTANHFVRTNLDCIGEDRNGLKVRTKRRAEDDDLIWAHYTQVIANCQSKRRTNTVRQKTTLFPMRTARSNRMRHYYQKRRQQQRLSQLPKPPGVQQQPPNSPLQLSMLQREVKREQNNKRNSDGLISPMYIGKTPESPEEGSGGIAFVTLFMLVAISASVWVAYAYFNPHSRSGQLLIRSAPLEIIIIK